jgi:L-threonylcarbamoyladenylate synthase
MNKESDDEILLAVECMRQGGIVAYPTETVYGLGCDPWNEEACIRVQAIKERSELKPMLLIASSLLQVEIVTGTLEGLALKLAEEFWPGPLTLVIKQGKGAAPPVHLIGASGGIAIRMTSHPVAAELANVFGKPVVSTSANISGFSPPDSYSSAVEVFSDRVDCFVKGECSPGGKASTIIDLTGEKAVVIREGAFSSELIFGRVKSFNL